METKESKMGVIIPAIVVLVIVLVVGGYMIYGPSKTGVSSNENATSTAATTTVSVATVNGVAISKAVYDAQVASAVATYASQGVNATSTENEAKIKTQVLESLINNEVLVQNVAAAKVQVKPADIETEFQKVVTQSGGAEGLKTALTQNNLTEDQLKANIAKQLETQNYLLANIDIKTIKVTDAEIAKFYADYSKAQKDAGQKTVPALKDLSTQIKQQLTANKEQELVNAFVATLRAKATVTIAQ
jgi:hypothetical protein